MNTHRPPLPRFLPDPLFLAAVAALVVVAGCQKPVDESAEVPPAAVTVTEARMGEVAAEVQALGTVMPVDDSIVASSFPGLVVEMPIRDGQFVRKGELLAQLREVSLSIQLEEAQALLRQREQELAGLEAGYRPEEVAQALARLKAAEALSKYTAASAKRSKQLHDEEAISDEELDESVYQAESAAEAVAEAKSDHELKSAGYRSEEIEAARAARDAQQYIVARLKDDLARRRIEAPFDGYVTERHTDLGQWVDEGGPVVTLVRLDEVEVRVQVEENAIQEIRVGQHVDVYVEALGNEPVDGEVRQIVPKANWQQGSRSFPVVVRVPNTIEDTQPRLKEGMLARITFVGRPRQALLVDKDSIDRSSGRPVVFVVQDDNRVRAVEVRDGMTRGQMIEIEGDVRPGDRLATEGVERLRPLQRVVVLDESTAEGERVAPAQPADVADETVATNGTDSDTEQPATATSGG